MGTILDILQWAIPGGGIGAAIAWIAHRKVVAAKDAKSVHDIYKSLYDDVSELLMKVQHENERCNEKIDGLGRENERTRRALNRLSRAIEAIQLCRHSADCPVRGELSLTEDDDNKPAAKHVVPRRQRGDGNEEDAGVKCAGIGDSSSCSVRQLP